MTKYKGQYYWELIYNNLPSFLKKVSLSLKSLQAKLGSNQNFSCAAQN